MSEVWEVGPLLVSIRGGIWRLALSISDGQTWLSDQAPGFSTPSTKKVQSKFVIAKRLGFVGRWTRYGVGIYWWGGRDWYAI